jgi:hypothetical protein
MSVAVAVAVLLAASPIRFFGAMRCDGWHLDVDILVSIVPYCTVCTPGIFPLPPKRKVYRDSFGVTILWGPNVGMKLVVAAKLQNAHCCYCQHAGAQLLIIAAAFLPDDFLQ